MPEYDPLNVLFTLYFFCKNMVNMNLTSPAMLNKILAINVLKVKICQIRPNA